MQSSIIVKTDGRAWELITNQNFLARWQELFDGCPWATTFQSPWFVRTWLKHYQCIFTPVLVYQTAEERLTALLILGQSVSEHKLVVAGGYQAEYQTWLEIPIEQSIFFRQALETIANTFPGYRLTFKYLPEKAPLYQLSGSGIIHRRIGLVPQPRLFTNLTQESLDQIFSNKRNQRSLKQLKNVGNLEFRRICEPQEFTSIVDEISAFYDFRQGAVHDRFPFLRDASKKPFHLDLLENRADLLHVTITTLDGKILAAHVGILGQNQIHLGIIAHSPFYARYSPGIVHLMLLCDFLFREGISQLDLTPGVDGAKERFANGCDQVYSLTLYPDIKTRLLARLRANGVLFIKSFYRAKRGTPDKAQAFYMRVKRFRLKKAGQAMLYWWWGKSDVQVYRSDRDQSVHAKNYNLPNKDQLKDLLLYEPSEHWLSKQDFMLEALKRLEYNEHFFTLADSDRLVFSCWLSVQQSEHLLPEVQQCLNLSARTAILENFYYDHQSMSIQSFQEILDQILAEIWTTEHVQQVILVATRNDQLANAAFKAMGLEYLGSLYLQRIFGIKRKWRRNTALHVN